MRTDLFDFDLPPDRIALRPASPRDAARLLVVRPNADFDDRSVRDLPDLLRPGDALVVNDTRVIPARLVGRRIGRGVEPAIEATLHQRLDGSRWRAFVKPASGSGQATWCASATRAGSAFSASSTPRSKRKARAAR